MRPLMGPRTVSAELPVYWSASEPAGACATTRGAAAGRATAAGAGAVGGLTGAAGRLGATGVRAWNRLCPQQGIRILLLIIDRGRDGGRLGARGRAFGEAGRRRERGPIEKLLAPAVAERPGERQRDPHAGAVEAVEH